MLLHMHMYRGQRTTSAVTPQVPSTFFFFETRSSLAWNLPSRLHWLTKEFRDLCVSASLVLEL